MKKTVHNFGDGPTKTTFEVFEEDYKLKLLTVKVKCSNCGHIWGIKISDYISTDDIPERKFKCVECSL